MNDFRHYRNARLKSVKESNAKQEQYPLCTQRDTDGEKTVLKQELKRLMEGYKANAGTLKGVMAEMIVPDWQKSANWVGSKNVSSCKNCGTGLGIINRKLHCRVGGEVFCSSCTINDLILYMDDGEVKWGLNGKDGGPVKVPEKYILLTVCRNCSSKLEDLITKEAVQAPPPSSSFLAELCPLHDRLSQTCERIETTLPKYKQLVESMDMADCSPREVSDKKPMHVLIKAHTDLSDALSSLAVESQRLKLIKPKTRIQEKLLRNVKVSMFRFHSENMYSFRNLKNHLSEHVPMETMEFMQSKISLQTVERVHVLIQQLTLEAIKLVHVYGLSNDFFPPIITISQHMDEEFKEFIEGCDESWEEHNKVVNKFIKEEMELKGRSLFKINSQVLARGPSYVLHYLLVSQCSSLIQECYREMQAKTVNREFKKVKESLHHATEKLDIILSQASQYS